ncbi:cytochrome P450 [Nocardia sp. R16R-3T]
MSTIHTIEVSDLVDPRAWIAGVPHGTFADLRANAPISWHEPETGGYWALTKHRDIAQISQDYARFTVERGDLYPPPPPETLEAQRNMLTVTDPPQHTRLRKLVSKSFTPRVVKRFDGWIREVVRDVLNEVQDKDEFDFAQDVAIRIPGLVIAAILGVDDQAGREAILSSAIDVFSMDAEDGMQRHYRGLQSLAAFVFERREVKRREPGDDLMSALNTATDDHGVLLTDEEYMKFVSVITLAGFETTGTLMSQAMRMMVEDPTVAQSVHTAIGAGQTRLAVEEFLRMVTPINYTARTALEDVEVGGQLIREGQTVLQWFTSANRDEDVFHDPDRYLVDRSPNPHMAFGGGGVHHCLGNHIARLETQILFEELHERNVSLKLAGDPVRPASLFTNQLSSLPVGRA